MKQGQVVLRNNTTHDDAVYLIVVTENAGNYTLTGCWGKWDTFIKSGKLGSKVYYSGDRAGSARREFDNLLAQKIGRSYFRVRQYDTTLPWEQSVPVSEAAKAVPQTTRPQPQPTRKPQPADPGLTRQDIQTTRAGLLEWE